MEKRKLKSECTLNDQSSFLCDEKISNKNIFIHSLCFLSATHPPNLITLHSICVSVTPQRSIRLRLLVCNCVNSKNVIKRSSLIPSFISRAFTEFCHFLWRSYLAVITVITNSIVLGEARHMKLDLFTHVLRARRKGKVHCDFLLKPVEKIFIRVFAFISIHRRLIDTTRVSIVGLQI